MGQWSYSVNNDGYSATQVSVTVECKATDNDEPVMVSTSISRKELDVARGDIY